MGIFHEINHPAIKGSMHLGMCMGCQEAEMDQLKKDIDAERKKAVLPCCERRQILWWGCSIIYLSPEDE